MFFKDINYVTEKCDSFFKFCGVFKYLTFNLYFTIICQQTMVSEKFKYQNVENIIGVHKIPIQSSLRILKYEQHGGKCDKKWPRQSNQKYFKFRASSKCEVID